MLAGGVSLLMTGAEVATHVVGGPVLAAAVHDARVGAAERARRRQAGARRGRRRSPAGDRRGGRPARPNPGDGERGGDDAAGPDVELQLLALQQQVQQENQRFTTVSNVMRAKHDTAKAAVSNIRA